MSTYFPNIPQSDEDPTDSQPLMLSNFQALNNAINRNHVDLSDTANSGRHEVVQMKEQSDDPTALETYGSLYIKDDDDTQNLYMRDEDSTIYKFTNDFSAATNGFARFPGGLQFKWGTETGKNTLDVINFPDPFTTACFNVQLTILKPNNVNRTGMVSSGSITSTSFTFRTDDTNPIDFLWMAIGL